MTDGADWKGQVGDVWAREWGRTDRGFAALMPVFDAALRDAAPAGPFIALDIGSGAGTTTAMLAGGRPDARVTGVDLSAELTAVARARHHGSANAAFVTGDAVMAAAELAPIDLFLSRHGVMFFDDPVSAFAGFAAAASPGARLVFSCFAARRDNRFAAELLDAIGSDGEADAGTAPGPFAFADPARVDAILRTAGWTPAAPRCVPFAYRAGAGPDAVADAVDFFCHIGPAAAPLRDAPAEHRDGLIARMKAACARRLSNGVVDFPATAWIWSATNQGEAL